MSVALSAAGPEAKYKAPRTGDGRPDLQGVWNYSSDVPLERPASFADRNTWTREELEAQKAAKERAFAMIAKMVPVEAVSLSWLDYTGQSEDLRTSLITYPDNGRVPKLVDGVRRVPGAQEIFAALIDAKGAPPTALLSSILANGTKDGPEDFSSAENFNRRTRSFAGAGNALEKVVTERFSRVSKDTLAYEATIVDPKTFQDKVVISVPMAKVDGHIYEAACHEGNYSMFNMLSASRKEEHDAMKTKP